MPWFYQNKPVQELLPGLKHLDFKNSANIELNFPYKPSLFLMLELAPKAVIKICF
jgi:hypothetical protein